MDQVSQIREKIDIVSFIGEFISLKRGGKNFKANCPFHGEKTPSFMVSPERQIWHCFGCGKGGDVYSFLMEYEHCDFPEALRLLAKRTGITLTQFGRDLGQSSKKEQMYQLNAIALEFYHFVLTKHPAGKKALMYLENRGVNPKVIETFQLGFAPVQKNSLTRFLLGKKNYTKEDLFEAGLATYRDGGMFDFFRGRLIFPLMDHRDNVVGFSGRILDDASPFAGPKYINTKETLIYHKGELFYGLHITKEAIRREKQAILLEGEFDVLSCFQEGVSNVVAVKGTALTDFQVQLLSRYVPKVTVCFDGDRAGQEAIKRSLPLIEKRGLATTVIVIPNGKDPDEALKKDPISFKKAVAEDSNVYEYLFFEALANSDRKTAEGKQKIADALLPTIADIENAIVREHYLKKISTELDTTYESILKEIQRIQKKELKGVPVKANQEVKKSREENLEEYLLSLILQSEEPKAATQKAALVLTDVMPKERAQQKIFYHLLSFSEKTGAITTRQLGVDLKAELLESFNRAFLFPLLPFPNKEAELIEISKVATKLCELYLHAKIKALGIQIKEKETSGINSEVGKLKENISELTAKLQALE